jgi:thioredoxin 1
MNRLGRNRGLTSRRSQTNRSKEITMSNTITLTEANYDEQVLNSDVPVLVDYWAPWCGPCRQLAPVIDQIAAERDGALRVGKVNVDEQPHLAHLAGVQGIPLVVLYRDGEPVAQAIGAQPKAALERALGLDGVDAIAS